MHLENCVPDLLLIIEESSTHHQTETTAGCVFREFTVSDFTLWLKVQVPAGKRKWLFFFYSLDYWLNFQLRCSTAHVAHWKKKVSFHAQVFVA